MKNHLLGVMLSLGVVLWFVGGLFFAVAMVGSLKENNLAAGAIFFSLVLMALGTGLIVAYRAKAHKAWKELLLQILSALTFWV